MTRPPSHPADPVRKRSLLLTPAGVGTIAVLGVGAFAATDGFGLGGLGRCGGTNRIVTSLAECEAVVPGSSCGAAFAPGVVAVGLTQSGSQAMRVEGPLRLAADGRYVDMAGRPFEVARTCRSSSSSSSSSSSGPHYYGWGTNSQGSTSRTANAAGVASQAAYTATQTSQAVQRGGFGATARSMSASSGS